MDFLEENHTTGAKFRWGIRICFSLWLLYLGGRGLATIQGGNHLEIFAQALFAIAKGILGVILLAPSLASLAARPLLNWIDSVYLPGGKGDKPPLSYHLADYYRKTLQTGYAIERYRHILRHYPKEAKAHAWLYLLLARELRNASAAAKARRRAKRRLNADAWKEYSRIVDAGTTR